MQSFALTAADKQLIKTFLITFIAVVAGLPVAAAIMPGRESVSAHQASGVTKTVADAVSAETCGTSKSTGAKSTKSTHEVVNTIRTINQTGSVNQNGASNQNGTNNSQSGAATVGRNGIAASVNALNDLVDVTDAVKINVGDVNVPLLSNNNTPILSGSNSGNGGLLGLGILGLL